MESENITEKNELAVLPEMAEKTDFKMVAKTLKGLEAVLADELRGLGARNVEPGRRMVSFEGDLEMLYRANLSCRTALKILKPFYTFTARSTDELYDRVKEFDWATLMSPESTFSLDTVMYSETFTNSRFVTYRVKDAIADWFTDRYNARPSVRLGDAKVMINVHVQGEKVTLSLDSSGESLHHRGWRKATTEAPISEVLAAGILLISGYKGEKPLVDPMCGSGTFLVEAALIAARINPGVFRTDYAFKNWPDFDEELFERLWNDDSAERTPPCPIVGGDILKSAVEVTKKNLKAAGVSKYVDVEERPLSSWTEAPAKEGELVMNPPYGERISAPDMDALYQLIGERLKNVFVGWDAWIIGYREEYFHKIGLAPSEKLSLMNGSLDCELREYIIFAGNKKDFRASGGRLKNEKRPAPQSKPEHKGPRQKGPADQRERKPFERKPFERRETERKPFERKPFERKPFERKPFEAPEVQESENPLAQRRNPMALKSITNSGPKLPPSNEPIMRSRGWKKVKGHKDE